MARQFWFDVDEFSRKADFDVFAPGFFFARLVPVPNLNANEDANHDNQKVQPDRNPVFFLDVCFDAAEDHSNISNWLRIDIILSS